METIFEVILSNLKQNPKILAQTSGEFLELSWEHVTFVCLYAQYQKTCDLRVLGCT